jgi:hypothetical protein
MTTKERIEQIQYAAEEKLLEAIDNLIAAEKVLTEIKGLESMDQENLTDYFGWLSLKFHGEHPELFAEKISLEKSGPEYYLAETLAEIAKKSIPSMYDLKGVSIRLTPKMYSFCISGSISEDNLEKLSGLRREWYGHDSKNQSDK